MKQRTDKGLAPTVALEPTRVRRILVPLDFSEVSLRALPSAAALARSFAAKLTLLHVVETYPIDRVVGMADAKLLNASLEEKGQQRLKEAAQNLRAASDIDVQTQVKWGKPFQVITQMAAELKVDMIVLTTHGFTGLKHAYLGSTAERVVRHAPCAVLVVR